ncbi:hypothetical protein WR25_12927 [Diploscapter pachys]|uniref:Uncharacterized protein n=1 Tax=Diploscapter pachys TaxID=2018661 RepID=A0A2A2LXJ0_9BILA|nr:hypothetical protein WR25_12927 [Diploscapter pachys]
MVYIGIDLGTTYSCISVIEDGKPVSIQSDDGKPIIPSVVAYCGTEILVGNPALTADTDISNVLYDSKRLIGYNVLNGAFLPDEESFLSFRVETRNGVIGYVLNAGQQNEKFLRPEEVSAEILKKLKMIAERHLAEKKITGAVVTVPAFFNLEQINATKRAVQMAGLDLKYLLEEPTAAAIAYYNKMRMTDSTIMVFDFGGGTLDISIAEIKDGKFDVKSVCGDAHLGGQDFDERIMKYVIEEIKKLNNYDISQQPNLMKQLQRACKEAKESLSFQMESWNINILVGGSTRIPKIQELLSNKFGQTRLRYDANPEVAVAHGAAIIANALENGLEIPLINNTVTELSRNINNFQIGGDNFSNDPLKVLLYCPDPPGWREDASVGYFKNKLYYLGGYDPETREATNRIDITTTATDPTRNNPFVKTITSEANQNPNIRDAIAIDIGTSKCKIAICKEKYIQIVEHESNRSIPSYVAYSEQGEWLVGRMAETYAVCLPNVIYDIRWLLGKTNGEINQVQEEKRYFFKRSEHLSDDGIATFDMIGQEPEVNVEKIFEKLLEPLFTTAYKNLQKANWTDLTIAQISEIKPIVENFAGDDIDRLIFDKMMEKLTQQMSIHYTEVVMRIAIWLKLLNMMKL